METRLIIQQALYSEASSMRVHRLCLILLTPSILAIALSAQQADSDPRTAAAYCTFDDGKEVSVRYNPSIVKDEPRNGKVWLPGGSSITLFTQGPLVLNNSSIPTGAYSVYVIPDKKEWTLIVNKNVTAGAPYDDKDDVARSPMELGEVDSPPKQVKVSLAHSAPTKCSIRLYYGKTGAFADFVEQQ
ncbi:MAG: DUF2911 domain-containing protein [Acidobacteriia bacterium]|nr:DUF2911 domain-containing protein [Terriglobia bacterium]